MIYLVLLAVVLVPVVVASCLVGMRLGLSSLRGVDVNVDLVMGSILQATAHPVANKIAEV
jgi:hypothetical protein